MRGRLRAGGAFGHLLLVVMLTLGVFAMHTMGHPEGSSGHGMTGAVPAAAGAHQDGMAEKAVSAGALARSAAMAETAEHGTGASTDPSPFPSGMDLMSVCVAVLTVWLLGLFLHAVVIRRRERCTALLARSMALARPCTPPPRPLLSQLSVLRI
ncbi:hypothetical protein SUDANB105_06865 [Streptomyces sp. enrichment culture]|uniref:DUF6153 family protein n=1 Tax=Streptomyces sp. enrichment culture TaxID=1795815 RepID=UPI003F544486